MDEKELKKDVEIEKNTRGTFEVKKLKRNAKIPDLRNMGEVILNLESVSKQALMRLFSTELTYYLNDLENNEEVKTVKITTTDNQGGDKVYFYNTFDKQMQLKSEMLSYFPYFLTKSGIMYGKITVYDGNVNVPFIIENGNEIIKFDTEVYVIPSSNFPNFNFKQSYDRLPVFIVDDWADMDAIVQKQINCLIMMIENFGRATEVTGFYIEAPIEIQPIEVQPKENAVKKFKNGATKYFRNEPFTRCVAKYQKNLTSAQTIKSFKRPYLEAEKRATDVKSRIYSKKAL